MNLNLHDAVLGSFLVTPTLLIGLAVFCCYIYIYDKIKYKVIERRRELEYEIRASFKKVESAYQNSKLRQIDYLDEEWRGVMCMMRVADYMGYSVRVNKTSRKFLCVLNSYNEISDKLSQNDQIDEVHIFLERLAYWGIRMYKRI